MDKKDIFTLEPLITNKHNAWAKRTFMKVVEKILHAKEANQAIHTILDRYQRCNHPMVHGAISYLGISYSLSQSDIKKIPKSGPVMIVSNHPYGVVDGLLQAKIALDTRDDVKILSNDLLTELPGMGDIMINANNWDENAKNKNSHNMKALRRAIEWLNQGHCLCVFPAGEVASWQWHSRSIVEPPWQKHIVRIATQTKAPILPMYFSGYNSWAFHALGLIHPFLRTIQLLREAFRHHQKIDIKIGHLINHHLLNTLPSNLEKNSFIKQATLALALRKDDITHTDLQLGQQKTQHEGETIAPKKSVHEIKKELLSLKETAILARGKRFTTYVAKGKFIPHTLYEIGRLREITFRDNQEGSGNHLDLDEFDPESWQLFLWDHEEHEIAGAYRLNTLSQHQKKQCFYSQTLFKIHRQFLDTIVPGIELGRSFIAPSYQKKPLSLYLLWQGIGQFIYQNQSLSTLFGPVSIASDYSKASKTIICQYLKAHERHLSKGKTVTPKTPWKGLSIRKIGIPNMNEFPHIDHLNYLVKAIEETRGIPILLKHYLKINCKVVEFNVDPLFSDVLDAFIIINTKNIKKETLIKYCQISYNTETHRFEDHDTSP